MIPTYMQLIDQAMVELKTQHRDGIRTDGGSCGLCYAINRAEDSFPRESAYENAYRDAMLHTLLRLLWTYGKKSRTDRRFLHPAPGQKGWKAERMRILRAMKRDFKGM